MNNIKIFENKKVRSQYDADKEIWYFSIVDIVGVLTDQPSVERARNYWKVLKSRLKKEGNESVTNCNQLKLQSEDGKFYKTDVGRACLLVLSAVPESGKTAFLLNLLLRITVKKKNLLLNRMTMELFPLL